MTQIIACHIINSMAHLKNMPKTKENAARNRELRRSQYVLRIGPQGRIVIPAPLRKALGLKPGDILVGWTEEDKVILQTRQALQEELRAVFKKVKRSLSEELIAERREESRKEAAEFSHERTRARRKN